jgi:hypothetical protein
MGAKWKVVGTDPSTSGEIVTVRAEQMSNVERLALESGMSEAALIENAGLFTPVLRVR